MAKTHKGIYQYNGDEGTNISLGQSGFKVFTQNNDNVTFSASVSNTNGSEWFVAFKAIGSGCSISATSLVGENFSSDCQAAGALNKISLAEGEMIWGAFSALHPACAAAADIIIAYYG